MAGQFDRAAEFAEQGVHICKDLRYRYGLSWALRALGAHSRPATSPTDGHSDRACSRFGAVSSLVDHPPRRVVSCSADPGLATSSARGTESPGDRQRLRSDDEGAAAALVVLGDAILYNQRKQIAALAAKSRLPSASSLQGYAEAGGLIVYSTGFVDLEWRSAAFVDKILKGAKPGDLPVEQPTKFDLVINLKTARALGLTIPQTLLLRADHVIE